MLHKELHNIGQKLPKRDKLGIHATIETHCVEVLSLAVEAAFRQRQLKLPLLEKLRVRIEVLKHLVRTEHELNIIDEKAYFRLSEQAIEISKMTNGWIAYTQKGA